MKTTILLLVLSLGILQGRATGGAKDHKNAPIVRNILSNQLSTAKTIFPNWEW